MTPKDRRGMLAYAIGDRVLSDQARVVALRRWGVDVVLDCHTSEVFFMAHERLSAPAPWPPLPALPRMEIA